jgi:hypothetical protein
MTSTSLQCNSAVRDGSVFEYKTKAEHGECDGKGGFGSQESQEASCLR